MAEQVGLVRLDALEERPLPAYSSNPLPSYRPDPPSTHPAVFRRAASVYGAALDEAVADAPKLDRFGRTPSLLPSRAYVFAVTSADARPTAVLPLPETLREARLRPDFKAPFGWKAAMAKGVKRVGSFKAWTLPRSPCIARLAGA